MNYPLTALQQAMLVSSLGPEGDDLYILQTVFDWREQIRLEEFQRSWQILAGHHEILRTRFLWKDIPETRQQVEENSHVSVELHSFSALRPDGKQSAVDEFLKADLAHGFVLSEGPPWRISLLHFDDGSTVGIWTAHHLLMDGRTHVMLLRELLLIYNRVLAGEEVILPTEIPQHAHVRWLLEHATIPDSAYWRKYLDHAPLPASIPGPAHQVTKEFGHSTNNLWLGSEMTTHIRAFAKGKDISAGVLFHTAWALVLGWLSGLDDVTFGAVRACRRSGLADGDRIFGMVINTLPLRVSWSLTSTLESVLRQVAADWKEFREHEQAPLQQIAKAAGLPANHELFTTAVSFSSDYFPRAVHSSNRSARGNRNFWLRQTLPYCGVDGGFDDDDFHISISTPNGLVDPSLAARLPGYLRNALETIILRPDSLVSELSLLNEVEIERVTEVLNTRHESAPLTVDWLSRISDHGRCLGDSIAVTSPKGSLSWRMLEERSNQLARYLQDSELSTNQIVAILLPRSTEFVWACLGIMKAGAAYLALDVDWPMQRIKDVLEDAQAGAIVSSRSVVDKVSPFGLTSHLIFEDALDAFSGDPLFGLGESCPLSPEQLAYVIYTSGSSGRPKGVEIQHRGLQNLIEDMIESFGLSATDRCSFISNTAFDASVHELWPALTAGASVHIPEAQIRSDPKAMHAWLASENISFSFVSTVMAEALLQLKGTLRSLSLRFLLTGGDQLRHIPETGSTFTLVNEYGPTEGTVVATRHFVNYAQDVKRNIPIGRPVRSTRAYIANSKLQLLPEGVPGELILAGAGIARGYRNRIELSTAKFVTNSCAYDAAPSLYRTGDLAYWNSHGELEFLGRIDSQVKLRGFRIELGEIESCLLRHPEVSEAVVLLQKQSGSADLAAFLVRRNQIDTSALTEEQISTHLRRMLPEYMIPSRYTWLTELPVNTSGKYDRKALADLPVDVTLKEQESTQAAQNATEARMLAVWEQVLGVSPIHMGDHFMALGATSLSIIQLICAIESNFGKTVSATVLMNDPRPFDVLRLLDDPAAAHSPIVVPIKSTGLKSPLFIVPGAGGGVHWFRELAAAMDSEHPVFGLELLSLSPAVQQNFSVETAATELMEVLLSQSSGPYYLAGYSGGGLIAMELAAKLKRLGKDVGRIILIETYPSEKLTSSSRRLVQWLRGWLALPLPKQWKALEQIARWYLGSRGSRKNNHRAVRELTSTKERHIQAFFDAPMPNYRGQVTVFSAEDRPLSIAPNPWKDWAALFNGQLEMIKIPGTHYSILTGSNAKLLAAEVSRILEQETRTGTNADLSPEMSRR